MPAGEKRKPLPDDISAEAKRYKPTQPESQDKNNWFAGSVYPRVSTVEAAERMDANNPFGLLQKAILEQGKPETVTDPGKNVVYWMNMEDMRLQDNKALSRASLYAKEYNVPLVVFFAISPKDYQSHDRSPRRIDFMLRNLRSIKTTLNKLEIPLLHLTHTPRKTLPGKIISTLTSPSIQATHIFANTTYEVDELNRNRAVLEQGKKEGLWVGFEHDRCIIQPGGVQKPKGGGNYTVYTPWFRQWSALVHANPALCREFPSPTSNAPGTLESFTSNSETAPLLGEIPEYVEGFELEKEDKELMKIVHPEGEDAAARVLDAFLTQQSSKAKLGPVAPFSEDDEPSSKSRIDVYASERDNADRNSSSRLSPYLASGVISARQILTQVLKYSGKKVLPVDKKDGAGNWVGEVAWRDFYNHILAAFPRVSMGQPYNVKYRTVQWETDGALMEAWKQGKTGYPIVDAAMRQMNQQGWMHNRARMISSSFLTKHLLVDWRLGERYFMNRFIDGDLASNNGGWQWIASTGTDPQPYFRVFNPTSQAEKADPTGDYIRHFVPELRTLTGKKLYDPHTHLSSAEFKKLNYPAPIVDHKMARERAILRYKNPGEKVEPEGVKPPKPKPAGLEAFGFTSK